MLRGVLVAAGSAGADFAWYAVTLSTGYFFGYLLSFGSIEGSFKRFPRLAATGGLSAILGPTAHIFSLLGVRGLVLVVLALALGLTMKSEWLVSMSLTVLVALVASYTGAIASVQRALCNHGRLAAGSLIRSVATFLLVVPAVYFADIRWVLAAELVGGGLGFLASCKLAGLTLRNLRGWWPSLGTATEGVFSGVMANRGLLVSISAVCTSMPYYFDRMFVVANFPSAEAANYALLALFLGAATLLVNTIAQRIGAESIKLVAETGSLSGAITYVFWWACVGIAVWLVFIGAVGLSYYFGFVPAGLAKYEISPSYLAPVAVLGALAVTALVEFLLLAVDEERKLFMSSAAYLVLVVLGATWVWLDKPQLQVMLWLMVVARAVHLLFLCASVFAKIRLDLQGVLNDNR